MKTKLLLAILAGFVWNYLGGWLVFGMLLHDFLHVDVPYEGLMHAEPDHLGLALFCISISALIALVIDKTDKGNVKDGTLTGLWVGFLAVLFFNGGVYAFMDLYTIDYLVKDLIVSSVFYAITGTVAGLVLGSGKSKA